MKSLIFCVLFLAVGVLAEERVKRQATYTFPGPRSERSHRPQPAYAEEREDDEAAYPRRQFQGQPVQQPPPHQQYSAPQPQPRAPQPPPQAPVYETPRQAAPRSASGSSAGRRRAAATATSGRANKYASAPAQSLGNNAEDDEDEEEQGPDPLTLLLQDSQFSCGGKNDGYYADDSVNCQVFHYCVGGAKHSWMCPENTVFHQVHLNCVPDAQDICSQSQKFHFVNDYLYKAIDYDGPNKTARYSQRYYPEGYVNGDTIVAPHENNQRIPIEAQRPAPPAPRPQARQVAPQQTHRSPPAQQQSRPAPRPSRPLESYPVEAAPQRPAPRPLESYPVEAAPPNYSRAQPVRQASPQSYPREQPQSYPREQPQPQSYPREQPQSYPREQQPREQPQPAYRVVPPQQASPQPAYRVVPPQQPSSSYTSSEESQYQPQAPPQRRPAAPQQRPQGPPRQQYRPSARSSAGYQPYAASNHAASGVQYDEDY